MINISEILIKISEGKALSPIEKQSLLMFGNEISQNSNTITAWQQGSAPINPSEIRTNRVYIGKEQYSGLAGRFAKYGLSLSSGYYTDIGNLISVYNDGFFINGASITIPETGRYIIIFQASFDDSPSKLGGRDVGSNVNGNPSPPQNNTIPSSSFYYSYVNTYDEIEYKKGDQVKFVARQDSGATLTMDFWVVLRKIR